MITDVLTNEVLKQIRGPENRKLWRELSRFLPSNIQIYLVGGYIRDVALSVVRKQPLDLRDMDFLIVGLHQCDLVPFYRGPIDRKTTFGGIETTILNHRIDIWTAQLQVKVAGGQPSAVITAEQALDHFTLTTNAIAYDFQQERLLERGFFLSFERQEIDLGTYSRWVAPWIPYHAAHLAHVKALTGFSLSTRASDRLQEMLSPQVLRKAIPYLHARKKDRRAISFLEDVLATRP